jgi:hypothetical protein
MTLMTQFWGTSSLPPKRTTNLTVAAAFGGELACNRGASWHPVLTLSRRSLNR